MDKHYSDREIDITFQEFDPEALEELLKFPAGLEYSDCFKRLIFAINVLSQTVSQQQQEIEKLKKLLRTNDER